MLKQYYSTYKYQESPSLSARKPENVLGFDTVGPTLNCHYIYYQAITPYHTTVRVSVTHEWAPIFEMLRFICWQRHLSDVSDHVLVWNLIIDELWFVMCVEHIEELRSFPNSVSPQYEVTFILPPVNITHREVVVLWHLQRSFIFCQVFRSWRHSCLSLIVELVYQLVVQTHLCLLNNY